jgi:NAD dependent epimerase/dehydratase family enzyme
MFIANTDDKWTVTVRDVLGQSRKTFIIRFWGMVVGNQGGALAITVIPFYLDDGKLQGATDGKLAYDGSAN